MSKVNSPDTQSYIIDLAKKYSGQTDVHIGAYVCRDLGIDREDAVEFYEDLESNFGIDLRPITECEIEMPKTWSRKTQRKFIARDPTLDEILAFVAK